MPCEIFPYSSHLLPIPLPLSLPPAPHLALPKVLHIALSRVCFTSFFLAFFSHSFSHNSVLIFVSLFSMHCHSQVNLLDCTLRILLQLKSDIFLYGPLGSIRSICLSLSLHSIEPILDKGTWLSILLEIKNAGL